MGPAHVSGQHDGTPNTTEPGRFRVRGAVAVGAVAACGHSPGGQSAADPLSGLSARQVIIKAHADAAAAVAVVLDGTLAPSGQDSSRPVDLAYDADGNCSGKITVPGTGPVQIVKVGDEGWMMESTQFIDSGFTPRDSDSAAKKVQLAQEKADALMVLNGKWLHDTTVSSSAASALGFCDRDALLEGLAETAGVVREPDSDYEGRRVVVLTDPGTGTRVMISDTSSPEVLRVIHVVRGTSYTSNFSYPSSAPQITPPPAASTISETESQKWGF
jgi:hypothetical protein